MKLRLLTLGRAAAVIGDRTVDPGAELLFAALLLLGLEAGRELSRDEMAALLWPDANHARQGARMRWLLNKLRAFGLAIESRATHVALPVADVELDFLEAGGLDPDAIGAILPGYQPDPSTPFGRWLSGARDHVATETVRRLLRRLTAATHADDWSLAGRLAAAIQRVDPLNEEAVLVLAEARCRLGAKAQALAGLDAYLDELGDDRSDLHLPARLLQRRIKNTADAIPRASEPAFVGRAEPLRRLDALLAAAQSGAGGALVVTGPAGIGKTRLLEEAVGRMATTAMQVLRVRCQRGDVDRPLSGLTDIVPQALALRGAVGADPASFAHLTNFANGTTAANDLSLASPEVLRAQLGAGVLDVLDAASAEAPVTIVVDDIQWADPSLAWFWTQLAKWSESHRVALLFSARTAPNEPAPLDVAAIALPSLDSASAGQLLDDALAGADRAASGGVREALLARGGGSPLFLREVVRQWALTGSTEPLPTSLVALFDAGVAGLGAPALRALEIAAILGTHATLERMERVMQTQRSLFIDAIVELENAGIITTDARGRVYGHVLWADVALKRLSDSIAHVLHRHAAECLDEELAEAPSPVLLWESARHWRGAGRPEKARDAITRGAEFLFKHGFPDEAAKVYGDAAEQVVDAGERLTLLRRRIDLLVEAGRLDELATTIEEHERLAVELIPAYDLHNDLEMTRAYIDFSARGKIEPAMQSAMACARNTAASSSHRLRAAKEAARFAGFNWPDVLREIREIVSGIAPRTADDRWNVDRVEFEYHVNFGDPVVAVDITERLVRDYRDADMLRPLASAMQMCGYVYWMAGRIADARAILSDSIKMARQHGLLDSHLSAYDALIAMSTDLDPAPVTRALIEEAKLPILKFARHGGAATGNRFMNHEARLCVAEGRPAEALRLVVPLEDALASPIRRWRAQWLAIHLVARAALGDRTRTEEIARALEACFTGPNRWMDWPAAVLAEYLAAHRSASVATAFAVAYLRDQRREVYPAPAVLRALADGVVALRVAGPPPDVDIALNG